MPRPAAPYKKVSLTEGNIGSGLSDNLIQNNTEAGDDGTGDQVDERDFETGRSVDPVFLGIIESLNLKDKFDAAEKKLRSYDKSELKLISDSKDPFTLYFDIKTDDKKEKYHITHMTSYSNLSPLAYKLVNSLITEEEELRISTSYERFQTLYRVVIDGVFYIFNYALYQKIMLFSKKDLLFMKAFKVLENGDLIEITASIDHPDFPETKGIERMKIIETMTLVTKMPEGGSQVETLNCLYPKVGAGFTILKPILSKSFRNFNKLLSEYFQKVTMNEKELKAEFVRFP